jgi:hypothetical protein
VYGPASCSGLSRSEVESSIDNVLIINGEVVMNGLIRPQTAVTLTLPVPDWRGDSISRHGRAGTGIS